MSASEKEKALKQLWSDMQGEEQLWNERDANFRANPDNFKKHKEKMDKMRVEYDRLVKSGDPLPEGPDMVKETFKGSGEDATRAFIESAKRAR